MTIEDQKLRAAYDVRQAVSLATETLRHAAEKDWRQPAADLEWSCWETVEHIADDLFTYAAQISLDDPSATSHVPIGWRHHRPGGPGLTIYTEEKADQEGLIQVLVSSAGLLAAVVTVAPADRIAFHPYGKSDPVGFAMMGVVETLIHMYDVTRSLDVPWTPPEDLCDRALRRLFRDAPEADSRWRALLWAAGRVELPGHPRRDGWKWDGTP